MSPSQFTTFRASSYCAGVTSGQCMSMIVAIFFSPLQDVRWEGGERICHPGGPALGKNATMKTLIVTGGTGGLGTTVVERLSRDYHCVLLTRDPPAGDAIHADLGDE